MADQEIKKESHKFYRTIKKTYMLTATVLVLLLIGLTILNVKTYQDLQKEKEKSASLSSSLSSVSLENESLESALRAAETVEVIETETEEETYPPYVPEDASLSDDPRYSVVLNYQNLGILKNVNNYLNIRKEPSVDSISIGKAMKNTAFNVIEATDNGWYLIESQGSQGYVSAEYVATGDEGVILAMEKCKNNAFARAEATQVLSSTGDDATVIFEMNPGNGYTVLDTLGSWVKVRIADGLEGYTHRDQVDILYTLNDPFFYSTGEEISELRLNVINYAFEWYGGDYVWGGTTLGEGVDCSGFTMRVMEHFGIPMPRLSVEQSEWGTPVASMEEAKPGDLLFFHGYFATGITEGVGHVAIYLGNGKMIHAASVARGIVMDNYGYLEEPICIRRVIND